MKQTLTNLFEKLENNFQAEDQLNARIQNIHTSSFYKIFPNITKQAEDIESVLLIKKRILNMRFRLLEKIQHETTKEMHHISTVQRSLNLQKTAA